jgi:hypothetical protein
MQIGVLSFRAGVRLVELNTIYPVGSGPSTRLGTRNVNRLQAARGGTDSAVSTRSAALQQGRRPPTKAAI